MMTVPNLWTIHFVISRLQRKQLRNKQENYMTTTTTIITTNVIIHTFNFPDSLMVREGPQKLIITKE